VPTPENEAQAGKEESHAREAIGIDSGRGEEPARDIDAADRSLSRGRANGIVATGRFHLHVPSRARNIKKAASSCFARRMMCRYHGRRVKFWKRLRP